MDMIIRRLWGEVSEGVGWGSLEAPVQCDATELRLIDEWMEGDGFPAEPNEEWIWMPLQQT